MKKFLPLFIAVVAIALMVSPVSADLNDGVVAHYPLDGNAQDASGNGNHGVEHGGVSYVDGPVGEAGSFDGIDDYIESINELTVDTSEHRTITAWANLSSTAYGRGIATVNNRFQVSASLYNHSNTLSLAGVFGFYNGGAPADVALSNANAIQLNQWYHLAGVAKDNTVEFYINGSKSMTYVHDDYDNNDIVFTSTVLIGYHPYYYSANTDWFDGLIDDVRIYSRALSESEIQELYLMGFSPIDLINQLVNFVISLNLQQGISNSLDAKLESALGALDDINENNDVAAINSMGAFINAVEAQRGNKISNEDADMLIEKAQAIIDKLES